MRAGLAGSNSGTTRRVSTAPVPRGLVLAFVLCALMFRDAGLLLLAGGLTWLCYELLLRRNRRLWVLLASASLGMIAFEAVGGWILHRHLAAAYEDDVDHRMVPGSHPDLNSDGIRCDAEPDDFTADTFNVIFLGDSFTYGFWIEKTQDAFPGLVEQMVNARNPARRWRSINFGWISSSPLLSLRLLRDIGPKYEPDLVILSVDMTDFHDEVYYRRDFEALEVSPTRFLLQQIGAEGLLTWLWQSNRVGETYDLIVRRDVPDEFYVVNQPLEDSRPHLSAIEASIRETAAFARDELGADFMLLLLPRNFQYSERESPGDGQKHKVPELGPFVLEPFRWLGEFSETVAFPCYSLLTAFRKTDVFPTCYERDPHWNPTGHRVAAERIVEILEQEGYVTEK